MIISAPSVRSAVGTSPAQKQVIAHRGFHDGTAPYENTVAAYRKAIDAGVDLMETDIRRTADGVLVLFHDASLRGKTISRTKYADLPLLPSGERVSTLDALVDMTAAAGSKTRLLVELKEHGYEAAIVDTLRSRLRPDQFELMSFDLDAVKALRQLAPDTKVGALFGLIPDWQNGEWPISGAQIVAKARKAGADFVAIDAHIASNERLQAITDAGLGIAVWTVDRQLDIQRFLADSRVRSIITNAPVEAMRLRDASTAAPPASHVTSDQAAAWWHEAVAA